MKFLKKILISMTIVLVLFSAIRNNTTVVKNNEVHADAIAALPILAANPELIPIFALGFFVLVTCKLAADNYENILAAGNEVANAIKAAGKSVSDFVNASGQIVMNEAFKNIVKSTVQNVSKGDFKHYVNYNSKVLSDVSVEGQSLVYGKNIIGGYERTVRFGYDVPDGWYTSNGDMSIFNGRVNLGESITSLTVSMSKGISGYGTETWNSPRLFVYYYANGGGNRSFIIYLNNHSDAYLQYLFSMGLLLDASYDSYGNNTGFSLTILPSFLEAVDGDSISEITAARGLYKKGVPYESRPDPRKNASAKINSIPFGALANKTRTVKYGASLFNGAIDFKSVEKSLDIAFPGTNDTLIPLDNVLNNPDSDVKDLKGLDAVLKNPNKFLDDDKRNKLDDVYKNAGKLDLKGIDNVSDKAKFNIKDYALDKTKVSDKDTPSAPLEGEHEKGTFSDIPILGLLGRLWDWLKEFAQELIKAIADGVTSIVNAIDKLFDLIDKILDFLVVDVLVGDLDSFKTNFNNMQKTLHSKFPDITPLNLSFTDKDGFDDFTADLPLVGHQVIIKGSFMNQFARPARAFFSGLFYFLTGLFFFRKFHKVSEG